MGNNIKQTCINFYTINSNFNDILLRLCKKIIKTNQHVYVNFKHDKSKWEADKFLWTKEKKEFIPHRVYGEEISLRDKIILFHGSYSNLSILERFQSLIISPCVRIKKFDLFQKFLVFSYSEEKKISRDIKEFLYNKNYIVNWYDEISPFKWKKL